MPEADGQSRCSALLCQDIAVDIFPAVDLRLLCRDARIFSCEDAGRCEVCGISGCDLDIACKACDVRSRLCKRGAVALALDLLRADGEAETAGGEDAGSLFFLEAVRMGVVLFRCRSEVSSCSDIRGIVREDVCRLQRHVLFGGEVDILSSDERAARLVRRIVDADGCPGARQEAACRMAMTVVIFGSFASGGEGDIVSGGKGSRAVLAFDGGGSCLQIVSGSEGDIAVRANLCAEFRTALCAEIVLRIRRHILLALEFLGVKGDVFPRREEDAAVFAECGKCCSRKSDVLSGTHDKNALIALHGDPGGRMQNVLMGELLRRAFHSNIILGFKGNGFVPDDRTLHMARSSVRASVPCFRSLLPVRGCFPRRACRRSSAHLSSRR